METFGYLQTAEEYESSESRDLVCVQNGLPSVPDFKISGQMAAIIVGTACSAAVLGSNGEAQAFPVGLGDSGPDVSYVQNLLANAGYFSGSTTGYFGGVTQNAVINFQSASGLVADGVVGSATLNALEGGLVPIQPGGGSSLRFGSSGSEVTRLQNLLNDAGYFVPVTGYFGSLTETAVRNFQAARGLSTDGIAGSATFAALEGFVPVEPDPGGSTGNLRFGSSGSAVTRVQNLLAAGGYFSGTATGYFGSVTEAAVRNFQAARGLSVDGIVGPATFAALEGFVPVEPNPGLGTVRRGDSGARVTQLQNLLNATGLYSIPVTGFFGPQTEAAVRNFQTRNSLATDGIAGSATFAALGA